jgi:thioesterase domain-containing protein
VLHNRQGGLRVMTTTQLEDYFLANDAMSQEQAEKIRREWDRVKGHTFKPYGGPLTLFRARAQPIVCSFDPEMNWRDLAKGSVSVEIVPGLHADVMKPRNIRVVAEKLKKCLEQIERTK